MRKRQVALRIVLVLVVFGAIFGTGFLVGRKTALPKELAAIVNIYSCTKRYFLSEPPSDEELAEAAFNGMIELLGDEHTRYLTPQRAEVSRDNLRGKYVGIGIDITLDEEGRRIITYVVPDSPAERAGLEPGDIVAHVDGVAVTNVSDDTFNSLTLGRSGTEVTYVVERDGEGMLMLTAIRAKVDYDEVRPKLLAGGRIGYIRLTFFSNDSPKEIKETLEGMLEINKVEGIILDLRGNPGGRIIPAISILSQFLPGEEVALQYRMRSGTHSYTTDLEGLAPEVPLAVLIDGGTASAAEVFVSAIRDHGRGVLIGTTTYGKGRGQVPCDLPNGGQFQVTATEFLSPDGEAFNGVGIQPDVFAPTPPHLWNAECDPTIEKALEVLLEQISS